MFLKCHISEPITAVVLGAYVFCQNKMFFCMSNLLCLDKQVLFEKYICHLVYIHFFASLSFLPFPKVYFRTKAFLTRILIYIWCDGLIIKQVLSLTTVKFVSRCDVFMFIWLHFLLLCVVIALWMECDEFDVGSHLDYAINLCKNGYIWNIIVILLLGRPKLFFFLSHTYWWKLSSLLLRSSLDELVCLDLKFVLEVKHWFKWMDHLILRRSIVL